MQQNSSFVWFQIYVNISRWNSQVYKCYRIPDHIGRRKSLIKIFTQQLQHANTKVQKQINHHYSTVNYYYNT